MRGTLGQTVIVESVPGAGGTLGGARLARAAPDGYTIGIGNWATHVGAGAIYPIQFDMLEFEPIAKVADTPLWIVTKNALPAKNLSEFVAWLKANADKATAGNVGPGSGGHLCGLYFQKITGTRFTFVPYRGGAPAMQDLVAGQIDFMCDMAANTLPQVRAGRIKAIAVMSKKPLVRGARGTDRRRRGRGGHLHLALARAMGAQGHSERRDRYAQRRRGERARRCQRAEAYRRPGP